MGNFFEERRSYRKAAEATLKAAKFAVGQVVFYPAQNICVSVAAIAIDGSYRKYKIKAPPRFVRWVHEVDLVAPL